VVLGQQDAVNPDRRGTKVAAHYRLQVAPGKQATVRLRLTAQAPIPGCITQIGEIIMHQTCVSCANNYR
jgi:hypothetical protein